MSESVRYLAREFKSIVNRLNEEPADAEEDELDMRESVETQIENFLVDLKEYINEL